jgi:uncharacterized repeat protein (TIGR03803 family)
MKTHFLIRTFHFVFLIWLILAGVFLAPSAGAAVDFEVLKSLGKQNGKPTGALIQDASGNFYGTTFYGGSHGVGTVFKIDASGNYSVLYEFEGTSDGVNPYATLVFGSDGSLYGVTKGNSNSNATAFKLSLSGNFSVLYTFSPGGDAGYDPSGGLTLGSDGNFYGATCDGGINRGTFYRIDSSGNLAVLHSFGTSGEYDFCPASELVQGSDGSFYGVTGGQLSYDIDHLVFKIDPAWNYSVLHYFLVGNQYNYGKPDDPYPTRLFRGSDGNIYGVGNRNIYDEGFNWVYRLELSGAATVLYQPDIATIPSSALLIQGSDGNFYGTTTSSADNDIGIVFKLDSSWNYSVVYEFGAGDPSGTSIVGLVQATNGRLYGTTQAGGSGGSGTVFELDLSGNYSLLHEFEASEGTYPQAGLIQGSDGGFYGTTVNGGSYGNGTVYKLDAFGEVDFLYSFNPALTEYTGNSYSELFQGSDGSFYGTLSGSTGSKGSVFKLDPSLNFSLLHNFDDDGDSGGKWPYSGLIQGGDGSLYGTTSYGGSNDAGTVFKIDSSGNFSVLHEFDPVSDGGSPDNLVLGSDGNIYGTSSSVQNNALFSVVFKLTPLGNFSIFHEFDQTSEGSAPSALIHGNDGNFYGATYIGGSYGFGTVFRIDVSGNYSVLHEFEEGGNIVRTLIQGKDGNFYGTVSYNAVLNKGQVFKLDAAGNISVLHEFGPDEEGRPIGLLLQASDGSLYGATDGGGEYNGGVIYRLTDTTQATTTALTSSLNPSLVGQSVTFTATVTGNSPTGTVEFFVGSTGLGSRPLSNGVAALSTPRLIAGTHSITAVYSGDANNAPSTSAAVTQVVKAKTGTTLTSSKNPSTFRTAVTFTASVKGNAPTGSVTFLDGSVSLGTAALGTDGKAKLTTAALGRGTHRITARYAGDANNAASTSAALTQTVR